LLQTIGTWSVFRSLGHDSGLIWVADDQTAKVSTAGVDVPLKTVGSLPDDGWNEAYREVDRSIALAWLG
jgi:hypothetical protein